MRLHAVINADAGAFSALDPHTVAQEIETGFDANVHDVTVSVVPASELMDAFRRVDDGDYDGLLVAGGDGTVAAAAGCLVNSSTALGIIPMGTMNLLAQDLGLTGGWQKSIIQLNRSKPGSIDVATVNDRIFLNSAVLGVFPRIATLREKFRGRESLGNWAMLAQSTITGIKSFRRTRLTLTAAPVTVQEPGDEGRQAPDRGSHYVRRPTKIVNLAISNNLLSQQIGMGITRDRLDEGKLGVYFSTKKSVFAHFLLGAKLALWNWSDDENLEFFETGKLEVESKQKTLLVSIDGEVARLKTPLTFNISPRKLNVLVPMNAETVSL